MALTPGLLLSDRYRLTHRIAIGGMGEVWAADDTRLARGVAVKILKSELTSDPEFVDRFRAEARITASLNHSGIAAVYDYGEVASIPGGQRDTAFLVMELVTGEPLSVVLSRTPRLSVPRTLDVIEQSGRALQVAHARALVHRDIKPGNILITPTGQVKITDFGIAKVAHQVPVTRGGMVMGTAQYLSPEQAAGNKSFPPSDVYSLGVVAYECLAGARPFNGENPIAVAIAHVRDAPPPLPPDIPPPVAGLVMRMLAKDPARRFPDGASLARAVAAVRGGTGATSGSVLAPTGAARVIPNGAMPNSPVPHLAIPSGPMPNGPLANGVHHNAVPGGPFPNGGTPNSGRAPGGLSTGAPIPGPGPTGGASSRHRPVIGTQEGPGPGAAPTGRPHAAHEAPVHRRTGVAVVIAIMVLVIVAIIGAIVLTRTGSGAAPLGAAPLGPATLDPATLGAPPLLTSISGGRSMESLTTGSAAL